MLKVENFSLHYKNTGQLVLKKINFEVAAGELAAILGPSGCGKTSLLNAIAGLHDEQEAASEGSLIFSLPERPVINMVFQKPTLLPWRTAEENVSFGLEADGKQDVDVERLIRETMKMVGLAGFEKYYPHQLSVGMQQRINFARAIICKPDLLLLDEPFSALDQETKASLKEEFKKIIKTNGITCVFVTHDVQEAIDLADKIIVFSSGPGTLKHIYENGRFGGLDQEIAEEFNPYE